MKIERLSKNDIQDILDLEKRGAPEKHLYYRYDKEALLDLIENRGEAFGIKENDILVAWCSYRFPVTEYKGAKGVYEMSSLVVDPKYRRKHLGLDLFNHRLSVILKKKDLSEIYATAHPANTPIICLYLNNGFVIYDFKKDKYGPGADRIYMRYSKKS